MSESPVGPRLVTVTGPLSGEVFSLRGAAEITFGRDPANTISVADPALSRHHCVFAAEPEGWTVRDVGSSNGTFVNGVQVATHRLSEGDRVAVGSSVFLFVNTLAATQPKADIVDGGNLAVTTTLASGDSVYLNPARDRSASRFERGLRGLLTISTVVHAARNEQELWRELLRTLRDVVPFEDAAIVAGVRDGDIAVIERSGQDDTRLHLSRNLVHRVVADRTAVLSRDAAVSQTFAADRLSLGDTRSVLCVPIVRRDSAMAVFYLVSSTRAAFDDDHLQLVMAVGRLAAIALENVRRLAAVERDAERLRGDLELKHHLVGASTPMHRVYDRIGRVARTDTTVLITGETGTGKELAARAIHLNGPRARKPFIAVNCAALAESLLESELFGHERGAFTNALALKRGRIELADGGTLFLDEIGELAPAMQSKLLRVLQESEFERVGGTRPIKVDVRLISATNRDLASEVRAGRFRDDLYFRLHVVAIEMPPLRERRPDIPLLALHFLDKFVEKSGRRIVGFSAAALACMTAYDWPGNVRELQNTVERAAVLGTSEEILPEDLGEALIEAGAGPQHAAAIARFHDAVIETKRKVVIDAFRAAGGSYTEAARALGLHPNYLHRLVKNLGLEPPMTGVN